MEIQSLNNLYQPNLPNFELSIYKLYFGGENKDEDQLIFSTKVSDQIELTLSDLNLSDEVPFYNLSKVVGYFFFFNNTWNYANQYQINYLDSVGDLTYDKDLIVKNVVNSEWVQNISGQKFKFISKSLK